MVNTLKKIHDNIKRFSESHLGIGTFYSNIINPYPNNIIYPLLYLQIGDYRLIEGSEEIDFTINLIDILNEAKDNDVDILSNMAIIAKHFKVNYLQIADNTRGFYFPDINNVVLRKIEVITPDHGIGWGVSFTARTYNNSAKSDIPLK